MLNPLKQWRSWVLVLLLVGPVLVYMGLGMLWLWEHGWVILSVATGLWVITGMVFSVLAARWTKTHPMMPPLDWESPQTFGPLDRDAWKLVQDEADQGESLTFEALLEADAYINSGRQLFQRLADHYHPLATHPIDDVPLVELMTALELAAEDLSRLCRQIPGGDLVTLSHYRKAVQVAGYISRANDLYSYLLPFLSPGRRPGPVGLPGVDREAGLEVDAAEHVALVLSGLSQPAGSPPDRAVERPAGHRRREYRRLTRKAHVASEAETRRHTAVDHQCGREQRVGQVALVARIREVCAGDLTLLKAAPGRSRGRAGTARPAPRRAWIEAPDYTTWTDSEGRRDRRKDARPPRGRRRLRLAHPGDRRPPEERPGRRRPFAQAWDRWFIEHPRVEAPPSLVVITGVEGAEFGNGWQPPYDWTAGTGARETAVRARIDALRAILPPSFAEFVAVGLSDQHLHGVFEYVLPALVTQLHRAERTALLRRLHELGERSKVGRLVRQLGKQGRAVWSGLRARRKTPSASP